MKLMLRTMIVSAMLAGAGCAQEPPIQTVTVTPSDFCQISGKLTWDLADTRPTIDGIRRHNAKYDSRCSKSKPTS